MPLLESHAFSRAQATRRIAASIILGVAMTLFVLGLTVLRHELSGHTFLAYWAVCFVLVVVVLFLALVDVWEIQRQARSRTRDLVRRHFLEPDFLDRLRHAAATENHRQGDRGADSAPTGPRTAGSSPGPNEDIAGSRSKRKEPNP